MIGNFDTCLAAVLKHEGGLPRFVPSGIVALRRPIRPTAIRRFVIAVVVNAIQRQARWRFAHVGTEIHETFSPSCAHGNSTSAVILKLNDVGIRAPTFHRSPNAKKFGAGRTMGAVPLAYLALCLTAATPGAATAKVVQGRDVHLSAVALAFPIAVLRITPNKPDSDKITELLTGNITTFGHHPILLDILLEGNVQ